MKQFNRRTFVGSATAAVVAASSPVRLTASGAPRAGQISSFLDLLRFPDRVAAYTADSKDRIELTRNAILWQASSIEFRTSPRPQTLDLILSAPTAQLTRIHLRWNLKVSTTSLVLGDAWERSYGDLAWRSIVPERPLPWYFATHDAGVTHGYGVKTGASAFCFWQLDTHGISLWLDVRNGGSGVLLGQRELNAASIVTHQGRPGEPPHASIAALCRKMCPAPRLPTGPVYGSNDWYYAYGNNSAEGILRDTDLLVALAPKGGARPFSVIDAGWAGSGTESDVLLHNPKFPDMPGLAAEIRRRGALPGIWIRPTEAPKAMQQNLLLPLSRFLSSANSDSEPVYDPTIPEAFQAILAKVTQVVDWNYDLVKHDYSTFDLFGQWGFQMGPLLTRPGWSFDNRTLTNAEIVLNLYKGIRLAAGARTIILGCNTVGHLAAGLFELQRTGDDTSGQHWERTRRMGVNTLAFRLPQNGTFFINDADCVGITKDIPWELNRQWLDLIARSGSALFLSPSPDAIGPEQKAAIAEAFAITAAGNSAGQPNDWLANTAPEHWQFQTGTSHTAVEKSYNWCGSEGCDPYSIS